MNQIPVFLHFVRLHWGRHLCLLLAAVFFLCAAGCGETSSESADIDSPEQALPKKEDQPVARIEQRRTSANVLMITIDTLRADHLGCYGNTIVETPVIDTIAAEGVRFDNCVAHAPTTLPSHTSIMTGCYPTRHGVHSNLGFVVSKDSVTLASVLKQSSFNTAAFVGAFPLERRFGLDLGFDVYDDDFGLRQVGRRTIAERTAGEVVRKARLWLDERDQNDPWFLWLHVFDPHLPYAPPDEFGERFAEEPYAGEISYVDSALKPLLDQLRTSGELDSTLVIITADHGEGLGDHGERSHELFAYNSTIHVPLIMRYPESFTPGSVVRQRVRHIDIMPTVLDALGVGLPNTMQGQSLCSLAGGEGDYEEPDSYFEALGVPLTRGWAPLRGLYHKQWKFIDLPISELYDMGSDFAELNNTVSTNAGTAAMLKKRLSDAIADTDANASPAETDAETREKLASLGYLHFGSAVEKKKYGPEDDPKNLVDVHNRMELAGESADEGDLETAISLLRSVVADRQDFVFAYLYLSSLLEKSGEKDEAVSVLAAAADLGIGGDELQKQLGETCLTAGQVDRAEKIFSDLAEKHPDEPGYTVFLAQCRVELGDLEGAEALLLNSIRQHPEFIPTRRDTGFFYLQTRRYQAALVQFDAGLKVSASNAELLYGRGLALEALRRPQEALRAHQHALEVDPQLIDAHFRIGLILEHLGRYDGALEHLRQVSATAGEPRRTNAQKLIERINRKRNR